MDIDTRNDRLALCRMAGKMKRPAESSSLSAGLTVTPAFMEHGIMADSQLTIDFDAPPTGRKITLAHKIALDPTFKQREYFAQAAGTARFVYNYALAEWKRQYEAGGKPTANALKVAFNAVKYTLFPWILGIHRDAHSRPFADLHKAFTAFFKRTAKYPRFKSKKRSKASFYVANDKFRVDGSRIHLPKVGWVRMRESLRFDGKIMGATVSRTADRWFVSIQVEMTNYRRERTADGVVGIDLGISNSLTLSAGEVIQGPKALRRNLKRLQRAARQMSRKQPGSKRREKARRKLARLHARIANIRNDHCHKTTTRICRENKAIGCEDLSPANMVKNRKLARAISDECWGAFRFQLGYKTIIYGDTLDVVDRFFPSSKTCHKCGEIKETLTLADREFVCVNPSCGWRCDRDVNAALNLKPTTAGLAESHARGPEGAGSATCRVKPCRVEPRTKPRSLVSTN